MPEWTMLEWLDAGTTPLLLMVVGALWRIDRRVVVIEAWLRGINEGK